ncbi:hypothetical protein LO763_19295 [Glycomyces sp. A-F 0318]|uniref:hypothetical protein n=1 Tax=Glycomyces amatae TaxID=2881355 RepID=UPI001E6411E2|nr:hypothetical protein [Glycomyces amatae]MCD0445757.1 hypothetical protein [Glycomyces amatae]
MMTGIVVRRIAAFPAMTKKRRPEQGGDSAFDDQQGAEYAAFIDAQLTAEVDRRKAHQSRAQSLITVSTVLLTFMGAIGVFAQFTQRYVISTWLQGVYGAAMLALVFAVGCGIWAGRSHVYEIADDPTLFAMVEDHWVDDAVDSRNIVATLRVLSIVSLQRGNQAVARYILIGQYAQLAFLALFTIAVLLTITGAERIEGADPTLK